MASFEYKIMSHSFFFCSLYFSLKLLFKGDQVTLPTLVNHVRLVKVKEWKIKFKKGFNFN